MKTFEPSRTTTRIPVRTDPGLRFAWAHAVLAVVLLLAEGIRLGVVPTEVSAASAMVLVGAGLPLPLRPVLGLVTWAFVTGFVVNELGELTLAASDLYRLGALVAAVGLVPTLVRRLRR
ncbi:hypothetical protein ABIE44_001764 [Marmoricola sp. OAE513]|uniref:hypothetical protein n=1 Tax=Marmoricola sp. OAE513 TaxID=2817894 RepID=UPI001AE4909A